MSGFFGIIMSSLQPAISTKSLTAKANKSTSSVDVLSTANKRGTLSYSWKRSVGKTSTINASTSAETTVTGLDTNTGSTTIYCDITDSVTGVTVSSPEAVITWTDVVYQNIVISRAVTYTGSAQAYTLTGTPATPAPSGTPSTFINSGTYVYPTNITSITTDSDYTLGTVSGSFTIGKAIITITSSNASMIYGSSLPTFTHTSSGFVNSETSTVITGTVTHSTTGTSSSNAGTYSITPSVSGLTATNYTFTPVNGTLTISPATLAASTREGSATFNGESQTVTVLSGINGTYSGNPYVSGINAGSYQTIITGTGNHSGNVTGTLTIRPATITLGVGTSSTKIYDGTTQSIGYTVGGTARNDNSYTISGASAINVGTYTATITSTTSNYVVSPTANSFTWNITTPLTASTRTGSATFNGSSQTVTVLSGINAPVGSFTGNQYVSGTNVGSYTTTITGTGNYTGSVTGTLTINQASLTASTTTSPHTFYNRQQQSFTIGGIIGTYSGIPTVYGTNAGSYSTTIYGTGNYTGSVTGTLIIYQDVGYVDIFYGGVYDASYTRDIIVPVRTSNAAFTVTHSTSGPGAADAQHTSFGYGGPYNWNQSYNPIPPGAVVRNTNPQTRGFVVTITAAINDPNYGFMSSETTVTVNAYVAPPPSGDGGFIAE